MIFNILQHLFLTLTLVLDPRIGYQGLLADCGDDTSLQSHLELAKDRLAQRYRDQYLRESPPVITEQPLSIAPITSRSPQKVNFTARYKKSARTLRNELEEFFKLPQEDFDSCDPLQWWAGRQAQFPNLSRFARDVLSIPG